MRKSSLITLRGRRRLSTIGLSCAPPPAPQGDQVACITADPHRRSNWSFLIADPIDHNILYKGGVNLCRSTDGGKSFAAIDRNSIHDDHHALVFHPAAPGVVLLGNDGGLYRTDNGGGVGHSDPKGSRSPSSSTSVFSARRRAS